MAAKSVKSSGGLFNVHFVGQGKGGVGKTIISSFLIQYCRSRGERVVGLSVDPVNQSLVQYEGLRAEHFEISKEGKIDETTFDALVAKTWEQDATYVIDAGASTFFPFSRYVARNRTETIMAKHNRRLIVHNVITGAGNFDDTMNGFVGWANLLPDKGTVLWVNEFFGRVHPVDDDKRVTEHVRSLIGIVFLERANDDLLSRDIEEMNRQRITFDEVRGGTTMSEFSQMRLQMFEEDLFKSISRALSRLDGTEGGASAGTSAEALESRDVHAG